MKVLYLHDIVKYLVILLVPFCSLVNEIPFRAVVVSKLLKRDVEELDNLFRMFDTARRNVEMSIKTFNVIVDRLIS